MQFPGPYAYAPSPMIAGVLNSGNRFSPLGDGVDDAASNMGGSPDTAGAPATTSSATTADGASTTSAAPIVLPRDCPDGPPPLMPATEDGDLHVSEQLLAIPGVDVDEMHQGRRLSALAQAAEAGHTEAVRALLQDGGEFFFTDPRHMCAALVVAATEGHAAVVELLLQAGARPDEPDSGGSSALHEAAQSGHHDVLACLLGAGVDVNVKTWDGDTALNLAIVENYPDLANMLLAHPDVEPDLTDADGESALIKCAYADMPAVAKRLLAFGDKVDLNRSAPDFGDTALTVASSFGHIGMVNVLLEQQGIDLDKASTDGCTPLIHATGHGYIQVVASLLAAGADVNRRRNSDQGTSLYLALEGGHFDIASLLLAHQDIRPDLPDCYNQSPLMIAAKQNMAAQIASLLARGDKLAINRSSSVSGDTALIIASERGHIEVVKQLLIRPELDLGKTNFAGKNALLRAIEAGHTAVVACLSGASAFRTKVYVYCRDVWDLVCLNDSNNKSSYAGIAEVLLAHGEQMEHGKVDFLALMPTPFAATAADLCGCHGKDAQSDDPSTQALAFFKGFIGSLPTDMTLQAPLRWMRSKGLSMAVSYHVCALLKDARAVWNKNGATDQQKMAYCLSALCGASLPGAKDKVREIYDEAGIHAAATERLCELAHVQLGVLAGMAADCLARLGEKMVRTLVDNCLDQSSLDYQVNPDALKTVLLGLGYCAPITQAITLAWQQTLNTLLDEPMPVLTGTTARQITSAVRAHMAARAPALFAQLLLNQLGSREMLTQLQALLAGTNEEGAHLQFQIQCDQLRQFCEQMLEASRTTTSSLSSSTSTSSTTSAAQE